MDRNDAEQSKPDRGTEEAMTTAVHNLVEEAVNETGGYTIAVEEEAVEVYRLPLQDTAEAAVGTLKNSAGAATKTSRKVAGSAIGGGMAMAEEAARIAQAAVDYVQDEQIIERTAALLDDAESEGKQLVNYLNPLLGRFTDR
jgi:hypothetical protein